jgi:predicted metal-dependent hydrolase
VLVHELCHLLQRNHSPKFWHEVETRCPDWRDHRDYLRMQGPTIKAEARRLFG